METRSCESGLRLATLVEHNDAWLLGAGDAKVSQILSASLKQAKAAQANFLDRLPALKELKQSRIPKEASKGFFVGVDGRKVVCDSEHLMLAGHLQNGEKCVMGHANVLWRKWCKEEGLPFRQIDFVHDEWQTEVPIVSELMYDDKGKPYTAEALRVGELQRKAIEHVGVELGIKCPLAGSTDTGRNWLQTH